MWNGSCPVETCLEEYINLLTSVIPCSAGLLCGLGGVRTKQYITHTYLNGNVKWNYFCCWCKVVYTYISVLPCTSTFLHLRPLCFGGKKSKPLPFPHNNPFDLDLPVFFRATLHSLSPLGQNRLLMSIFAAGTLCVVHRLSVFLSSFRGELKSAFTLSSPRDSCHFGLAESLTEPWVSFTGSKRLYHHHQLWLEKNIMFASMCQCLRRWEKMVLVLI